MDIDGYGPPRHGHPFMDACHGHCHDPIMDTVMDPLPWTPVMGIVVNACHGDYLGRLTWTPVIDTGINPSFLWHRERGGDRVSITSPDGPSGMDTSMDPLEWTPGMDPRHGHAVMEILS